MMEKKIVIIEVSEDGSETKICEFRKEDSHVNGVSDYARFFNSGCPAWTNNSEYNLMFLKIQERYANDILKSRGHIFLNEVYDMLGIARTKAGQVVGWIYADENPTGDNYVSFGLYDTFNQNAVNGCENTFLLDFNVDGMIVDKV
jgi:hypothetical protein